MLVRVKAVVVISVLGALAIGLVMVSVARPPHHRNEVTVATTLAPGIRAWPRVRAHPVAHATVARATSPAPVRGVDPHPPSFAGVGPVGPTLTNIPPLWVASTHDVTVGGVERTYLMIRPPVAPGAALPVVVIMHGRGMTPASMERASRLLPVMGQAIAVYPAGWGRSWNAGGCCGVAHRSDMNDVTFLSTVVHQVLSTQPDASPSHVFLVGFSNGGRMAFHLACAEPGMFAGLAAIEAVPVAPCAHITPLPTVIVASTGDPLLSLPIGGRRKVMQGYRQPTVAATVDLWRGLDGCSPSSQSVADGAVSSTVWAACSGRGRLEYDLYQGGRHTWPQGTSSTPSAQSMLARFLWGLPAAPPATT